jgi:hypothetical protein
MEYTHSSVVLRISSALAHQPMVWARTNSSSKVALMFDHKMPCWGLQHCQQQQTAAQQAIIVRKGGWPLSSRHAACGLSTPMSVLQIIYCTEVKIKSLGARGMTEGVLQGGGAACPPVQGAVCAVVPGEHLHTQAGGQVLQQQQQQ